MMNFALKMSNFALKPRNFAFKMMNSAGHGDPIRPKSGEFVLAFWHFWHFGSIFGACALLFS